MQVGPAELTKCFDRLAGCVNAPGGWVAVSDLFVERWSRSPLGIGTRATQIQDIWPPNEIENDVCTASHERPIKVTECTRVGVSRACPGWCIPMTYILSFDSEEGLGDSSVRVPSNTFRS